MKTIILVSAVLGSLTMAGTAFAASGPNYQYGTLKELSKDGTITLEDGMKFSHASPWEIKHLKVGEKVGVMYDQEDNSVLWVARE